MSYAKLSEEITEILSGWEKYLPTIKPIMKNAIISIFNESKRFKNCASITFMYRLDIMQVGYSLTGENDEDLLRGILFERDPLFPKELAERHNAIFSLNSGTKIPDALYDEYTEKVLSLLGSPLKSCWDEITTGQNAIPEVFLMAANSFAHFFDLITGILHKPQPDASNAEGSPMDF